MLGVDPGPEIQRREGIERSLDGHHVGKYLQIAGFSLKTALDQHFLTDRWDLNPKTEII